ncbi:MAG: NAD(P)H-dependent oxidoreductase [Gammaproteobacteria bacterium]|nr:NAD(P)H-dependent oxidoreductase [Gammaproteobacteria bacterium]
MRLGPFASVLILFAHPYPHRSRVNRAMLDGVRDLPGVVINDLYEQYPNFHIDPQREQALLQAAKLVVMQHPIYWYSQPALLQQWKEKVLTLGFAYGPSGDALRGKGLLSALSTGQSAQSYRADGANRYAIEETLRPLEMMANHCGMTYLPPFVIHGAPRLGEEEIQAHVGAYRLHLQRLIQGVDRG